MKNNPVNYDDKAEQDQPICSNVEDAPIDVQILNELKELRRDVHKLLNRAQMSSAM